MRDLIPIRPKSLIEVEVARDETRLCLGSSAKNLQCRPFAKSLQTRSKLRAFRSARKK
jgi:hypothetical protein